MASYEVEGRTVRMPCVVGDASVAVATFTADAAALRGWLPPGLDVVELRPGRALLSLSLIDYRENDLGAYDELSVAAYVRPLSAGRRVPVLGTLQDLTASRLGTYIHRLPVTEPFTCAAGRQIWGFPKDVDALDLSRSGRRLRGLWRRHGRHVLTLDVRVGGRLTLPPQTLATYTMIDGVLHATPFTLGGRAGRVGVGDARLVLGEDPFADDLRDLRLSRRPVMTLAIDRMRGRFGAPVPVSSAVPPAARRPHAAAGG